jgi:hypothetical protein
VVTPVHAIPAASQAIIPLVRWEEKASFWTPPIDPLHIDRTLSAILETAIMLTLPQAAAVILKRHPDAISHAYILQLGKYLEQNGRYRVTWRSELRTDRVYRYTMQDYQLSLVDRAGRTTRALADEMERVRALHFFFNTDQLTRRHLLFAAPYDDRSLAWQAARGLVARLSRSGLLVATQNAEWLDKVVTLRRPTAIRARDETISHHLYAMEAAVCLHGRMCDGKPMEALTGDPGYARATGKEAPEAAKRPDAVWMAGGTSFALEVISRNYSNHRLRQDASRLDQRWMLVATSRRTAARAAETLGRRVFTLYSGAGR